VRLRRPRAEHRLNRLSSDPFARVSAVQAARGRAAFWGVADSEQPDSLWPPAFTVGYMRERGEAGYQNRSWRRHTGVVIA
jgi:hypothetical protein